MGKRILFEIGQRFGRLTIVAFDNSQPDMKHWRCMCSCGTELFVRGSNLNSGHTKSCGCEKNELTAARNRTHSAAGTLTYNSWISMLGRCLDKNNDNYPRYGGRGIAVCERWRDFQHFLADMGERPSKAYSIDRWPDNDGNYEPSNCRWATDSEQSNNRSTNRLVTFLGKTDTITNMAKMIGIPRQLAYDRLRDGLPMELVFSKTGIPRHPIKLTYADYDAIRSTFALGNKTRQDIAEEFGVTKARIGQIIRADTATRKPRTQATT